MAGQLGSRANHNARSGRGPISDQGPRRARRRKGPVDAGQAVVGFENEAAPRQSGWVECARQSDRSSSHCRRWARAGTRLPDPKGRVKDNHDRECATKAISTVFSLPGKRLMRLGRTVTTAAETTPEEEVPAGSGRDAEGALKARAARSSLWSVLGHAGSTALGLIAFVLLSPLLSPADYGLVGMAGAIANFLSVMGDAGMIPALVRSTGIDEVAEATAFWLAVGGAGLLATVSLIAAPILGWFYGDRHVTYLAIPLALSFLFAVPYRVAFAKLMRALDFKTLTLRALGANLVGVVAAWIVARLGGRAWALVTQSLVTFFMQSLLFVMAAPYCVKLRVFSRERARKLVDFGGRMGAYGVSLALSRTGDSILGGRYVGPAAVGIVGMGVKLVGMPVQRVSNALSNVFLPTVVQLDSDRQGWAFARALRLTGLLIVPLSLGVFAVAPELVALLPPRWAVLTNTLRLYALGSLLEPIGCYSLAILIAHGRARSLLRLALILIPIGWGGTLLGEWLVVGWMLWSSVNALSMLLMVCWRLELGREVWIALSAPLYSGAGMVLLVRVAVHVTGTVGRGVGFPIGLLVGAATYGAVLATLLRHDAQRLFEFFRAAVPRRKAAPVEGGGTTSP